MRSLLLLISACLLTTTTAFAPPRFVGEASLHHVLQMASEEEEEQRERLAQLGYSEEELDRAAAPVTTEPKEKSKFVAVTEFDIDPVTLTFIGFGLIAANFFIFANLGDGGVGGVVATIMNTWDN
jgi:hypothetical protein